MPLTDGRMSRLRKQAALRQKLEHKPIEQPRLFHVAGMPGAWQNCDGGAWYPYLDAAAWGPPHTQFQCPP